MSKDDRFSRTPGIFIEGKLSNQSNDDIWYSLKDASRYLYHYTTADTLCNYILQQGRLRFSRFENVNDPRGAKDWRLSLRGSHEELNLDFEKGEKIVSEMNRLIKFNCKMGCFSCDPKSAEVTRAREDEGEDIIDAIYHRGHSRPNLWWHYGDRHRGVCLIFDRDQLEANINAAIDYPRQAMDSGEILYKNPPVVPDLSVAGPLTINLGEVLKHGSEEAARLHFDRFKQRLFFNKCEDWTYENEFRFLITGIDDADFYVSIKSALAGILVGDEFPDEFKSVVDRHSKRDEFDVATMTWTNGVPQPKPAWKLA